MKSGDEEGVKVESLHVMKSKVIKNNNNKKKKKNEEGFVGCWNNWGFIGSCVSSRSKVDSTTSGISSHFGKFLHFLYSFFIFNFVLFTNIIIILFILMCLFNGF